MGFKFSIREFAGSLGDFGTLIPFTVGYIVICGFNPSALLIGIGLTNIILALIYKLPLPVQPKKVIGSVALARKWSMNRVLGAGFSVGIIWVLISFSTRLSILLEKIPKSLIRGIQLGLAFTLAITAAEMINQNIMLSAVLIITAYLLLKNRFIPSSIFLVLFGFIYAVALGSLSLSKVTVGFSLPQISIFSLDDMVYGFLYAGFAQLFLTLINAVVATVALIHDLFPDRKDVTPRNLIQNMGAMNMAMPFIGGMPLCHGAGGLAAQYLFGARTGGAILMEGAFEISLGLFFSESGDDFHILPTIRGGCNAPYDIFYIGKSFITYRRKKRYLCDGNHCYFINRIQHSNWFSWGITYIYCTRKRNYVNRLLN